MSSLSNILLILGAGGRVGASVATLFGQRGYSVAIAARSLEDDKTNDAGWLEIRADLSKPDTVASVFGKVRARFGGPPSVVVYNAAAMHAVPPTDPLALAFADLQADLTINTGSVLVAAQQAISGFQQLPSDVSKTFIYTGNFLNTETMPALMSGGIGKSATAHLVRVASEAYAGKNWRFYYADERKADGFAAFRDVNGQYHAEHYLYLAESKEAMPWLQTFVGGEGFRDFSKM